MEEEYEDINQPFQELTAREIMVIKLRFGIDSEKEHSLEEIGTLLGVTQERIRQIEAKSLRKLRHPEYSDTLKIWLDSEY